MGENVKGWDWVDGNRSNQRFLPEIKQRLRFDHRHLIGISRERVNVQFGPSSLEVNIAERLEPVDFQFRELDKDAPVPCEALEVRMTLTIEIGAHSLNLKIRDITRPLA